MCLGRPCRVVEVPDDGTVVVNDAGRSHRVAAVALDQPPTVGEWLLVYAGIALERLGEQEVRDTLALRNGERGEGQT
jgi:hydrogenase assembly chaperone HypC/HupF